MAGSYVDGARDAHVRPARPESPLVEGIPIWRPVGRGVLPYPDVSEGSPEGPQTSAVLVSATTVIPSSRPESTLTAGLHIDPEVEPELELEQTHVTAQQATITVRFPHWV